MSTTSNSNTVALNVFIPGRASQGIATFEVSEQKQVNVLKPMIKEWWASSFKDLDLNKIEIYQKIILPNVVENYLESINFENSIYMDPLSKISDYFHDNLGNRLYKDMSDSEYEHRKDPGYNHKYTENHRCIHILIKIRDD